MNNYIYNFGIEIHLEVNSNQKAFSNTKFTFDSKPNTCINEYDIGLPGAKPIVNKDFALKALKAAKFFNMKIASHLEFDRKHYFYTDLPKGFQITQYYKPLGTNGYMILENNKKIKINRIHMEEDTAKQKHKDDLTLIDYNRAGNPLIEIVTDHNSFESIDDVINFIDLLRKEMMHLDISDGKLEEGSMRIDANVSVRTIGQKNLNSKTEIKNINSLKNLRIALKNEIKEQTLFLEKGKKIQQATKRFDAKTNTNILMRKKESSKDYKYIYEPNIVPIKISEEILNEINNIKGKTYTQKKLELIEKYKLDVKQASEILEKKNILNTFYNTFDKINDTQKAFNLLNNEISALEKSDKDLLIDKHFESNFITLVNALSKGEINSNQAKLFISDIYKSKIDLKSRINKNISQEKITDKELINLINQIIGENNKIVSEYNERPERVEKFITGQLMKLTKGKANPVLANKLIKEKLKK